jgi:hypothetical protein
LAPWQLHRYGCWAGKAERAVLGDGSRSSSDNEKRFGIPTLLLVDADAEDGAELDFTVREKVEEAVAVDQAGRKAPLFRVDAAVHSFASCKKLAANM